MELPQRRTLFITCRSQTPIQHARDTVRWSPSSVADLSNLQRIDRAYQYGHSVDTSAWRLVIPTVGVANPHSGVQRSSQEVAV